MSMRRRAWCGVMVAVCFAACTGACATGAASRGGADASRAAAVNAASGTEEGTTESLIARSAAGLERVLSGEQKRAATDRVAEPTKPGAVDGGTASVPAPAVSASDSGAPVRVLEPAGAPPSTTPVTAATAAAPNSVPVVTKLGALSGWWEPGVVASVEGQGASPANGVKPATAAPTGGAFWHGSEGDESAQLRISQLALCTRVEGFGKVVKVESVRATGRAVPLLIYTQVDGFSCREQRREGGSGENDWVIELGQSVVVYRLSADGRGDVQVKVEPEQTARDVSAFKRRDHYLVQRIELPTPLVSGRYAVKVTVRDKRTGMVDEKVSEVVVR